MKIPNEIIAEHYGEFYNKLKPYITESGWVKYGYAEDRARHESLEPINNGFACGDSDFMSDSDFNYWRPKSLNTWEIEQALNTEKPEEEFVKQSQAPNETKWLDETKNHTSDALQMFLESRKHPQSVEQLQHDVEHMENQIKSAVNWFIEQNPNIIPLVEVGISREYIKTALSDVGKHDTGLLISKKVNVETSIHFANDKRASNSERMG